MKTKLLNLIILLLPLWSFGQSCGALMTPISIEERINESTIIVEGVITNQESYWDSSQHNIYTVHTVDIYTNMLGNNTTTVKVVTMGGQVGDATQITSSEASLRQGNTGTFFLKPFQGNLNISATLYELVGAAQGVIKYDKYSDKASDIFNEYQSVEGELYNRIQNVTRQNFRVLQERPAFSQNNLASRATPIISNFLPNSISAGTQSILTINGSNFGSTAGSVGFADSNSGGASYVETLSSQIISWSDTQIQVEVPYLAGTGNIRVTNSTAETGTSNSNLTVTYNHINLSLSGTAYPSILQDRNGSGGFTFLYHTDFDTSAAKPFFEDAFELWNCESDINFTFEGTTTTDASIDDGINIVRFDNGSELPLGVLGRVTTRFLGTCATTNRVVVKELDITWNDSTNWYYGSGTPSSTQHDFKSVALHELGHAHQLGHVIDDNLIMHYSIGAGDSRYTLNQNDIDGAVYTMGLFTQSVGCSVTPMTEQVNCCDAIVINSQPSDSTIEIGSDTQFTIDASNFTTVNWLVSLSESGGFSTVSNNALYSGANTTALSLQNVPEAFDGYRYRARLQNQCGEEVFSNIVNLNVIEYTSIPDTNFEAALSAYDDIPNDGQVPTANIETLTGLYVSSSGISDLTGIEDFVLLTELSIASNNLTVVSLSSLTNLEVLDAEANFNLNSLDVSANTALRVISLEDCTALTTLDLSTNTSLEALIANQSGLASITLGTLPNLAYIELADTNLTSLDFSSMTSLLELNVRNNQLTSLNIANGNNTNITSFDARDNANLFCITVDDVAYAQTNFTNIDIQSSFSTTNCFTAIPDTNFETALFNLGYDDVLGDNQVPTGLIAGVTTLDVINSSINDLTGIEDFASLTTLDIAGNNINNLDLTNNTQLEVLQTQNCNLQNLNIEGLTNLYQLSLQINGLTSLDLSTNTAISSMNLSSNDLTYLNLQNGNNGIITLLDIRFNTGLECVLVDDLNILNTATVYNDSQTNFSEYDCRYTAVPDTNFETALENFGYDNISGDGQVPTVLIETLTSLNVANANISDLTGIEDFAALETLVVFNNSLTSLDLSNNLALTLLSGANNNISTIDFGANSVCDLIFIPENNLSAIDVAGITSLTILVLDNNPITSIDVSNNNSLDELSCDGCNLFSLNIKNGNNTNISNSDFDTENNPNLSCVLVDDAAYSSANWTKVDPQTVFNDVDCTIAYTAIPDANFEAALGNLGYDDIPSDGQVPTATIETVTTLNVSNANISDLTGIEAFTALTELVVSDNNLTTLDVSNNTSLIIVAAANNTIDTLTLGTNSNLAAIAVQNNNLTTLDTSGLTALSLLQLSNNPITELDLSANTALQIINCQDCNLSNLNIQNGNNTAIASFNTLGNPNLTCVQVDDATYATANWTNVDAQTNFSVTQYCEYTAIPDAIFENALDFDGYDDIPGDGQVPTALIENIVNLSMINIGIADLTGIEDFAALEELNVDGNFISMLDLSSNTNLIKVACQANGINTINLTGLTALEEFNGPFNSYTTLDVSTNSNLKKLYCNNTGLTTLDVSSLSALTDLNCSANFLTTLNVRNGNNINFTNFDATNNTNLTCILVDDATYSNTNWTNIDATASFTSTDYCRYTAIPDSNFEAALMFSNYDDMPGDGQVPTALIEGVTSLNVSNSGISDLTGIEDFTLLESLNIRNNNVITLDLSANTALTNLNAVNNNLTSIDLSNSTLLEDIRIEENDLTTVDLSNQPNLRILQVDRNDLNIIDLSANTLLERCRLYFNNLTSLDLSNNPVLSEVTLQANDLNYLNLKSGGNTNITNFNAGANTNLTCILVDDAAYSTTNWTNIDAQTSFSNTYCRYTTIPDSNFETALDNLGYDDISGDGQVPTALIESITNLDVQSSNISDLTGIEDFVALEVLNYDSNAVLTVDLSNNTALRILFARSNGISSIDVSANTNLRQLFLTFNNLTSVNVSNNIDLTSLWVQDNQLTGIDISNNLDLINFGISNNQITDLDLSNNVNLVNLFAANNNLVEMDLSLNSALVEIGLASNDLESVDVRNGNNTIITKFNVQFNPNLTCILVDDATYSTANWDEIDAQTSFSDTSCTTDFSLALKVYLQGAALNPYTGEETLMRDDLRDAGLIPTTSPYTDGLTCDASVFNATGNDAIVDWVWVELRDATDNTSVSYSRSALLQRDGDVVDVDGTSLLTFNTLEDTYSVAIQHRNHLGIVSADAITFTSGAGYGIDFTNNSITLYGSNAQTTIGMPSGIYGMWAGDADGDGILNFSNDGNSILFEVLFDPGNTSFSSLYTGADAYYNSDMDVNGNASFQDDLNNLLFNILFHPGNTSFSSLFSFTEQLPENSSSARLIINNEILERRTYVEQTLRELGSQIKNK